MTDLLALAWSLLVTQRPLQGLKRKSLNLNFFLSLCFCFGSFLSLQYARNNISKSAKFHAKNCQSWYMPFKKSQKLEKIRHGWKHWAWNFWAVLASFGSCLTWVMEEWGWARLFLRFWLFPSQFLYEFSKNLIKGNKKPAISKFPPKFSCAAPGPSPNHILECTKGFSS